MEYGNNNSDPAQKFDDHIYIYSFSIRTDQTYDKQTKQLPRIHKLKRRAKNPLSKKVESWLLYNLSNVSYTLNILFI